MQGQKLEHHLGRRPPSDPTKLKIEKLYLYGTFYIAVSVVGDSNQ